MKNKVLLIAFLVGTNTILTAQKISLRMGVGHGAAFSSNHGDDRGRILLVGAGYFHSNDKLQFGIEANYSGSFIEFVGGNPSDIVPPPSGAWYLDPTNMAAISLLGKVRYTLSTKKGKPYFEMGIGTINYFSKAYLNGELISNQYNFSLQPEVGIQAGHFQFAMRYVPPGKTPAFDLIDETNQQHVILESITIQQILFVISFSFAVLK